MPYEKPEARAFVSTDTPMCLTEQVKSGGVFGCPCQCLCPCPCPGPCSCPGCQGIPRSEDPATQATMNALQELTTAPRLVPRFQFRSEEFGGVLFDTHAWNMLRINEVGSHVLLLADGQRSINDIATELAKRHGIAKELIIPDIRHFLALLTSIGAVTH